MTSIGENAFHGCKGLTSVTINSNAVASKSYTSSSRLSEIFDSQVKNYTFGEGVEKIGDYICYNLSNITTLSLPASLTTIGKYAFNGCTGLTDYDLPDGIVSVGQSAFPTSAALNVNRGTTSLLALWNANYKQPHEKGTENVLAASSLSVETTQMTATVKVNDFYPEFENTLNGNVIDEAVSVFTSQPNKSNTATLRVTKDAVTYTAPNLTYTTLPISPTATRAQGTASSMAVKASYLEGDAEVTSQTLTVNGVTVEGDSLYLNGLKPNTTYKATYTIKVNDEYEYTGTVNLKTDELTFKNEMPKVISEGNIVVASQSNLDYAEENVGFQWRRNDWTADFESKSAGAYFYEGMVEGYIRNLNSNYLWKFRPYYQAADGTYFYGSWSGMDPSDFSFFEPTVHTYSQATVDGNTAEVKGYAQRGTDDITSQGFIYWKAGDSSSQGIPSDAQRVEANGTVMTASLTGLDYETDYNYVAFITTSEGETFYGDTKTFRTEKNPTGVESVQSAARTLQSRTGVYDLSGRKVADDSHLRIQNMRLPKGIYIVKGKKVVVK